LRSARVPGGPFYPNGRWWQPAVTRDAWLADGVVMLLDAAGLG
jgi:hypothetical protein